MLSDDYIIRMIRQAIAVLKKIIGLKQAGDYQESFGRNKPFIRTIVGNGY
jgi:hypothetical protein